MKLEETEPSASFTDNTGLRSLSHSRESDNESDCRPAVCRRRPKHGDLEEHNDDLQTPAPHSTRKRLRRKPDSSSDEGELPARKETRDVTRELLDADSPSPPKRLYRRAVRSKRTREQTESSSSSSDSENLLQRQNCLKRRKLESASIPSRSSMSAKSSDSESEAQSQAHSEDENDLELPESPCRPKPSAKDRRMDAIKKLKDSRNHKGSPTAVRRTVLEDVDSSSSSEETENEDASTQDETKYERASSGNDFIDDADVSSDQTQQVQEALGILGYERRSLKEQFMAFIEYLVELDSNPHLEGLAEADELSFKAAFDALKMHTRTRADTMQCPTWIGSFKTTLNQRPTLVGPVQCEDSECQACWTRGKFKCSAMGCYALSTRKGFYDPKTFEDIPERGEEYTDRTTQDHGNSAQADSFLYPPGFRLVLGEDCAHRAAAYHQARHYLYHIAVRVRDEIERVGDLESEDLKDQQGLMDRMTGEFGEELWRNFCLDSKQWEMYQ